MPAVYLCSGAFLSPLFTRLGLPFFPFYFTIGAPAVDTVLEKKEPCRWESVTVV